MARILALMNAHSLAHVTRLIEIGKVLRSRGHEISFGGCGKYLRVASDDAFETIALPYISLDQMVSATRSQRKLGNLYKLDQIEGFIDAELELYSRLRPALILDDNRVTAVTSAELAEIKLVSIINVHITQYKDIPFYSLGNVCGLGRRAPFRYLDRIENLVENYFIS